MQIHCANCRRAVTVAGTGAVPDSCPHCRQAPVPAQLGRWRIERLLAAGGMGEVYLARHCELATAVAVKLLPPRHGDDDGLRQRFLREAVLTARVEHPGVVRVLDFEVDGDRQFLVMEYLEGRSLRSLLREGPLPPARAVAIAAAVADVLATAHRQGVVHRDIKPENIFVEPDGRVRVLDFGIARALQDQEPLTRTGEILGTPEYMAPEQLLEAADAIDARTDVHALGVLLYELLTGRSPFHAPNLFAVLKLVESLQPPAPSTLSAGIPPALDAIVTRCLAKAPDERFADAGAVAGALRALAPEGATALRRPRWSTAAIVAGALILGGGIGAWWHQPRPEPPPSTAAAQDPVTGPGRRLAQGAFHAALVEFEPMARGGEPAAAEQAALAWLCAHQLLPAAVGAPEWLLAVDAKRCARLLGRAPEDRVALPDHALATAMLALAHGDAVRALALLRPKPGTRTDEPAATLALLAAHRACADRTTLAQLSAELQPGQPGPAFVLLAGAASDPGGIAAALTTFRDGLDPAGADRWLAELFLAFVESAGGAPRLTRMRAAAELAWLTGAGEVAVLWYAGLRVHLAQRPGLALGGDEAAQLLTLLGTGDHGEHPVRAVLEAMLQALVGDRGAMAGAFDRLQTAAAAGNGLAPFAAIAKPRWQPFVLLWTGDHARGITELRQTAVATDPGADLLLALFDSGNGAAAHWPAALAGGDFRSLELLRPLPGTTIPLPIADHLAGAARAGVTPEQLLPLLRALARCGNDPAPLLATPALQPLQSPPLRDLYVREVQGGVERR